MAVWKQPFTGHGLKTPSGGRLNYSWVAIGSGPSDANPLLVDHATVTTTESSSVTTVGTTAYNGFTDSYASPATISGTVEGYLAASDGNHATDPQSGRAGTRAYMIVTGGTFLVEGWILLSDYTVTLSANEICTVKFSFTYKALPIRRTLGFLQGGCPKP
jgi:hypothetical protein